MLRIKPSHGEKNTSHIESMGQFDRDSLLICVISHLRTMEMNEGGRKHAVLNTNRLSDEVCGKLCILTYNVNMTFMQALLTCKHTCTHRHT